MTTKPERRNTRGHAKSGRTKEQQKERHTEQVRRYAAATGAAHRRLKAAHEEEFYGYLDEELAKVYTERGPLPHETQEGPA